MAQTDARPGFRLPWNSERSTSEQTEIDETAQVEDTAQVDETAQAEETAQPEAVDGGSEWPTGETVTAEATDVAEAETPEPTEASAPETPAGRRPSKFMVDLTKAMQAAAEEARTRTIGQFQADAKGHIEQIHGRSSTEAADLRRQADDDVAAVREWSKLEIARIREETEGKISARKGQLESQIEMHAAQIEREIEIVQGRVSEFEAEMAAFFERLLAEDDPTSIASMAERLPEPPPFDTVAEYAAATIAEEIARAATAAAEAEAHAETEVEVRTDADETTAETTSDETTAETTSDEAESVLADETDAPSGAEGFEGVTVPDGFEIDREAAFAAVQAAAEAAASAEVATDAANRAEDLAELTMDMVGSHDDGDAATPAPDFDAAEAEAATSVAGDGDEITEIGDDDLAARLAGLVPGKPSSKVHSSEAATTQVVVVGLVSVASIASFKRHLGRVSGVQSVGVSSGPDGEFMFAVHHSADVVLRDAIPSLPSFQARVTSNADGVLNVTAHDPESDK
jgi:hypothetical protein